MANLTERITVNPEQCNGRPCIRGMRIRVTDVLDLLANGLTSEQILEELPDHRGQVLMGIALNHIVVVGQTQQQSIVGEAAQSQAFILAFRDTYLVSGFLSALGVLVSFAYWPQLVKSRSASSRETRSAD